MELITVESLRQPSLAILTMPSTKKRQFRGDHCNFIDLIRTGKEMGAFVYVVTPQDLRENGQRIYGYIYNPHKKTWARTLLPYPQVIYNRIPSRKDEQQPEVQYAIQSCMNSGKAKLFNPFFFDKRTLFEWLDEAPMTRAYIPSTGPLRSSKELKDFLRRYPVVYLKPARGKAGKGIMKIEIKRVGGESRCRLSIQDNRKSQTSVHAGMDQLWSRIKEQIEADDYIIQQGIRLARSGGRPFDLRVLVQKNRKGEWKLTGVGARVAGKRSITTHVPRGGRIEEPETVLSAAFGGVQVPVLLRRVKTAALTIARQIEKGSGARLGEMSMDLGVDTLGRLWFFEANSHPMKFDEPDIRKKSLERIIQYSLHLSRPLKKSR